MRDHSLTREEERDTTNKVIIREDVKTVENVIGIGKIIVEITGGTENTKEEGEMIAKKLRGIEKTEKEVVVDLEVLKCHVN